MRDNTRAGYIPTKAVASCREQTVRSRRGPDWERYTTELCLQLGAADPDPFPTSSQEEQERAGHRRCIPRVEAQLRRSCFFGKTVLRHAGVGAAVLADGEPVSPWTGCSRAALARRHRRQRFIPCERWMREAALPAAFRPTGNLAVDSQVANIWLSLRSFSCSAAYSHKSHRNVLF